MTSNDLIILDQILKQRRTEIAPDVSESKFFELFCAEQVLKDFDLSYEEIDSGLVGDGGDGGIDGMFLFVNGELVQDDADFAHLKKNISIDLVIVQSKLGDGFKETPVERFITVSEDILDLSRAIASFQRIYNSELIDAITRFRSVFGQLLAKFPAVRIRYHYTCRGAKPGRAVERKGEKLLDAVRRHFPNADCKLMFEGASELLAMARRQPQSTYSLKLAETPVSSGGKVGFVCLVKLADYYEFISSGGTLRRNMFEANVRDYQGRTEVNDAIQKSLADKDAEDFWWLNNGITIIASQASHSGKSLTIEDPQIVNGLQTSTEVFEFFRKNKAETDQRKLLVRVIVPDNPASRDRIIKATNSQTAVQQASLRATDKIHRDIEEYCRPHGLFYDRRKNYYKNDSKPLDKIVSTPFLAQAVMAVVLKRPDTARARPASLLKSDEDYAKVYDVHFPMHLFYVCAESMRRVEAFLRANVTLVPAKDRNNVRFYVAMAAVRELAGAGKAPSPADIAGVDVTKVDDQLLQRITTKVMSDYSALGGGDQVAKGASLLQRLGVA